MGSSRNPTSTDFRMQTGYLDLDTNREIAILTLVNVEPEVDLVEARIVSAWLRTPM
jgi:hypothetical protein